MVSSVQESVVSNAQKVTSEPAVFQDYKIDAVLDKVSLMQERMKQTPHAPQEGQEILPADDVLSNMVRQDIINHLVKQDNDPLSLLDGKRLDTDSLLNKMNVSPEDLIKKVKAGIEDVKVHFGVEGLAGREVVEGVMLYNLQAEESNAMLSQMASPSMLAELRKGVSNGPVLGELLREGNALLAPKSEKDIAAVAPPVLAIPPTITPDVPRIPGVEQMEFLGSGGMGYVYRCQIQAQEASDSYPAVVKVLKAASTQTDRFNYEGQVLKGINTALGSDPGIPRYFESGISEDGVSYFIQEYVPGVDLAHEDRGLSLDRAAIETATGDDKTAKEAIVAARVQERLELLSGALQTLQKVHETGMIHRDLKPANLMMVRNPGTNQGERIVILDFGIAKPEKGIENPAPTVETAQNLIGERPEFTRPGGVIGTPAFMSPEQALGNALTTKTDVFSMGVILYESATGVHPFSPPGGSLNGNLQYISAAASKNFRDSHEKRVAEDPSLALDEELLTLISDALEKKAEDRPTAGELAERLEQYLERSNGQTT